MKKPVLVVALALAGACNVRDFPVSQLVDASPSEQGGQPGFGGLVGQGGGGAGGIAVNGGTGSFPVPGSGGVGAGGAGGGQGTDMRVPGCQRRVEVCNGMDD